MHPSLAALLLSALSREPEVYRVLKSLEIDEPVLSQGSKIRSSYISFAQKEKKRLGAEVAKYAALVEDKEKEVEKARQVVEEVERGQGEMMEKRKNSRESPSRCKDPLAMSSDVGLCPFNASRWLICISPMPLSSLHLASRAPALAFTSAEPHVSSRV